LLAMCAVACGGSPFTAEDRMPSQQTEAGSEASSYPVTPPDSGSEASEHDGGAPSDPPDAVSEASSQPDGGAEGSLPSQCCIDCILTYTNCEHGCVNTNDDASDSCNLCDPGYLSCSSACGGNCPSLGSI
jgi:hypothetical protein